MSTRPVPVRIVRSTLAILVMLAFLGASSASAQVGNGTIRAIKGGDRVVGDTGNRTYASPVAGAGFEYTTSEADATNPASGGWTAFPGLTGVDGTATVSVPPGTYFVRERTVPTEFGNFGPVQSLSYDPNSSVPSDAEPYVAKVIVTAGQVTEAFPNRSPSSDTDNWNSTSAGSTGSPFINVRDNEAFPNSCGINILLVLDRSGSIGPFRETYRDAARAFVNALDGTPTQIGILSFSAGDNGVNSYQDGSGSAAFTHSPLDLSVAGNATTLNSTIDSVYTAPSGGTNWDRALQKSADAKGFVNNGATGQTTNADVVVFITDGNPTARSTDGSDTGSNVDLIDLTAGMSSANLVKNQSARALAGSKLKLYALGVGSGVTPDNLKAVSGPVVGEDYETPTVAELTAKLRELAARTCGARIFVRKRLAGNPANQADWGYSATTTGGMISYLDGNPRTHATSSGTIETGVILTQLPAEGREVTVTEDSTGQPLDEFNLDSVTCSSDSYDGAPVTPVANTAMGVSLAVQRGSALYCTFTNSRKLPQLTLSKTPNNQTINAGEDAEFSIVVANTGTGTARDVVLTDTLPTDGTWTISEDPGGCSIAAGVLTCDFGDLGAGATRTVKIKTATTFAQCTVYNNDASVASSTEGGVDDNGNVITCLRPNLTIVKTPDNGTINAGEDAEFTIVIGNTGDGVAKNVTLSDQLPAPGVGGWIVSQQPSQGTCSIDASNLLTCAGLGDLAKDQTRTIKVRTGTSNDACTVYDNPIATADGSNSPPVSDGGSITCLRDATVTVVKDAQPDAAQDFDFTTTGAGLSDFSLDDDADATLPSSRTFTFSGSDAGAKTITESAVAGWSNTSVVCSEGLVDGSTATLQVDPGDDITCTYVNKRAAKLTIVKDAQPDGSRDFDYTTTGAGLSDFSLDDDADPALSNTKVFTVEGNQLGEKSVTEQAAAGWSLADLTCSKGTVDGATVTVDLAAGDDVTCTYVNKKDATVRIIKDAVPNDAQDFAYTTTGAGLSDFSLDDDANATLSNTKVFTVSGADFGSKSITESARAGWDLTALECSQGDESLATRTATLAVDPGDVITCTFTNTKRGSVSVEKTEGRSSDLQRDWVFELSGNGIAPVTSSTAGGNPIQFGNLRPGTYTLCEVDMPIEWHSSLEQAPHNGTRTEDDATNTARVCIVIDIAAGESASFEVDNVRPGIELDKTVRRLPDGSFAKETSAHVGDTVVYRFVVTNAGVGELSVVLEELAPDRCDSAPTGPTGDTDGDQKLDVGENWVYRCTHVVTAQDPDPLPNTARVTGTDEQGNSDTDDSSAEVDVLHPDIAVDKKVRVLGTGEFVDSGLRAHVGDTLEYRFVVTDGESDTPIVDVQFSDPRCDAGTVEGPVKSGGDADASLEDGEAWTYTCTHVVTEQDPNPLPNTATVTGEDELGEEVEDDDSTSVEILKPGTLVVKEGNQFAYPGDTVTFTFAVTNNGNTPLSDVSVTDDRCAPVTGPTEKLDGDQDDLLEVGEKWMFTCSKQIPADHVIGSENPIRNVAVATGKDPLGRTVQATDDHNVTVLHPAIDIEKTGPATALVGTALAYTLTVTNPGDVPFAAQEIGVTDPRCEQPPAGPNTGADATPSQLDPGDIWTYTCTAQTTGQPAGTFVNTATVTGRDFNGRTVTDTDDFPTELEAQAVLPEQVVPGTSRLSGPSGCVRRPFNATVRGSRIARVTFFRDGKRIKTITAKPGQVTFKVRVRPSQRRGVHRVTARVVFETGSGTQARTLRLSYQRCARQVVRPRFTG